jgi:hypothetical protein
VNSAVEHQELHALIRKVAEISVELTENTRVMRELTTVITDSEAGLQSRIRRLEHIEAKRANRRKFIYGVTGTVLGGTLAVFSIRWAEEFAAWWKQ